MSRVVVLHAAEQRPALEGWGERLRGNGHEVWLRGPEQGVDELPAELVYVGFSTAATSAGYYAATRVGARGAILIGGVGPVAGRGAESWPQSVPAQVHFSAEDSRVDRELVAAFEHALEAARAPLEIHVYPGAEHHLADPGSPGYDAAAAELLLARVLGFLRRFG